MDFKLNPSLSNDDLVGVLKTLWLFLESIDFSATSTALRSECLSKGYTITTSSQTTGDKHTQNGSNSKQEKRESKDFDSHSHNVELEDEREVEKTSATQISNKCSNKALNDRKNDVLRKSSSNPSLLSNEEGIKEVSLQQEPENYQDIKKQFSQLQNEHRKLMAVTSQLTQALQTQVLGQSESLNATLNSCRNIYPDLFNSPRHKKTCNHNCSCNKATSTRSSTSETIVPETNTPEDHSSPTEENNSSSIVIVTEKEEQCLKTDRTVTRNTFSKISVKSHSTINSPGKNVRERESKRPQSCKDHLLKSSEKQTLESPKRNINTVEQQSENKEEQLFHKLPEVFILNEKLKTSKESLKSNFEPCIVHQLFDLDFPKIKEDMMHKGDSLKLAIIQALRWRITQNNCATRAQVVLTYSGNDLLDLRTEMNSSNLPLIESYLMCGSQENCHLLQEEMSRFLNTLASLSVGRDYLCQNDELLVLILVPLISKAQHSLIEPQPVTRDMLIATLQKLSLRHRQRTLMLTSGLLEHLITFLASQHQVLNEYCMEYSTALFMNLCLHKEARELVASRATEVICLLVDLLNEKYYFCMPYVNGATYSLLLNPIINQEAKNLEFGKLIMYHIENTEGEMRRQLEIILKLHQSGVGEDDCKSNANIEPEEEGDLLEPELDSGDSLKIQPCGEKVLESYKTYTVFGPEIGVNRRCKCFVKEEIVEIRNEEKESTESSTKILRTFKKDTGSNLNGQNSKFHSSTSQNVNSEEQITQILEEPSQSESSIGENSTLEKSSSIVEEQNQSESFTYEQEKPERKKGYKVPPSFTKTIQMQSCQFPAPLKCNNPCCPLPYVRAVPVPPIENSSAQNPPYACNYSHQFSTCYRESYNLNEVDSDYSEGPCVCCSTRNKYSCNCYNVIKESLEIEEDFVTPSNVKKGEISSKRITPSKLIAPSECDNPQQVWKQKSSVFNQKKCTNQRLGTLNKKNSNNNKNSAVKFSYKKLLTTVSSEGCIHVCSNSKVNYRCYDDVFLSRPKILRTPP